MLILYAISITDLPSHSNLNNIRNLHVSKLKRNVFLYKDLSLHDPTCSSLIHIKVFPISSKYKYGKAINGPNFQWANTLFTDMASYTTFSEITISHLQFLILK